MSARKLSTLFGAWLFSFITACSSTGHINSLDDLTAQVDVEGLFNLPQQRLLSLSGLMPNGPVGSMYRYDKDRSPFTAIGISQERMVHNGKEGRASYQLMRRIEYKPELDAAQKIEELCLLRDQLVSVRQLAGEAIAAQLMRANYARRAVVADDQTKLAQLEVDAKAKREAFAEAWKTATEMIRSPGLLVIRTNTSVTQSLGTKIGNFFGLNAAKDEEHAGFAILAGVELSMLYLGTDLEQWAKPSGRDWSLFGSRFPYIIGGTFPWLGQFAHYNVQVLTSRMSSEYVLYASDKLTERQVQAKLEATVEQLSNLDSLITESDKIVIEGILTAVESLGNVGVLGPVLEKKVALVACTPQTGAICPDEDAQGGQTRWRTIYEVLTDYDDIERMLADKSRLHLSRWF